MIDFVHLILQNGKGANTVQCQTDIMHMRNTHGVQRKVDCKMRFRDSYVNVLNR